MKLAIHSVFICKENICFLEEWILYHISIGFNKFYLYDNSKVEKSDWCDAKHKCFIEKKVNKYGVHYDKRINLSNTEVKLLLDMICQKFSGMVEITEWSPRNEDGVVCYLQREANNHCLSRMKRDGVDWCAFIDMDEYICTKDGDSISNIIHKLPNNISNLKLSQYLFESRFLHKDKLVTDINRAVIEDLDMNHSNKNIVRIKDTDNIQIHKWFGSGEEKHSPLTEIWFNHYKKRTLGENYRIINNIPNHLKQLLKGHDFLIDKKNVIN